MVLLHLASITMRWIDRWLYRFERATKLMIINARGISVARRISHLALTTEIIYKNCIMQYCYSIYFSNLRTLQSASFVIFESPNL